MQTEWTAEEHEAGLAQFVDSAYRQRFKQLLKKTSRRGREKSLGLFDHYSHCLDARYAYRMEFEEIETWLQRNGAPSVCYVVSSASYLDRQSMPLDEALDRVDDEIRGLCRDGIGHGVLISCVPGKLGSYHDHENWSDQLVLYRR